MIKSFSRSKEEVPFEDGGLRYQYRDFCSTVRLINFCKEFESGRERSGTTAAAQKVYLVIVVVVATTSVDTEWKKGTATGAMILVGEHLLMCVLYVVCSFLCLISGR